MVILVIDKMNRTTAHFSAVLQDRLMNAKPIVSFTAKGRDQRRMDVDDPVFKIVRNVQVLQETSHDDQADVLAAAEIENRLAKRFGGREFGSLDDHRRKTRLLGDLQATSMGRTGDDDPRLGVQLTMLDLLQQVPQRCSAAGNQHRQRQRLARSITHGADPRQSPG